MHELLRTYSYTTLTRESAQMPVRGRARHSGAIGVERGVEVFVTRSFYIVSALTVDGALRYGHSFAVPRPGRQSRYGRRARAPFSSARALPPDAA